MSSGNRNCWPHLGHFFSMSSVMVGFDLFYIVYSVRPETVKSVPGQGLRKSLPQAPLKGLPRMLFNSQLQICPLFL
jgi:hypothetical protein